MVTEIFTVQLKWFTRKLIEIRVRELDGYHTPIDFDPANVSDCTVASFDTANKTPQEHVVRMLNEIRGFLAKTKQVSLNELSWALNGNHIEISGYTTELLQIFLKEFLKESSSLFGEAHDTEDRTILTYNDQDTDIHISGNELAVFRCLLRNFGRNVPFGNLHQAIRNQDNLNHGESSRNIESRITSASEKTSVRSAVYEVEEKLKTATGYRVFPEIIKSVYGIGYSLII